MIWVAHKSNLINGIVLQEYLDVAQAEQGLRNGVIDRYIIVDGNNPLTNTQMESALRDHPVYVHQPMKRDCRCTRPDCQNRRTWKQAEKYVE